MKIIVLISSLLSVTAMANAQLYAVDLIPSGLTNRAHTVVRDSRTRIDMRSQDNVIISVSKAITVLNKNGDEQALLALFYDKNTSIKSVKGEVYDEFGKQVTKFSLNNFKDESAINDFSLFQDSRVKYYIPQAISYPYTIIYDYEIRNKQNLVIPDWKPMPGFGVAVEKSSYQFVCNLTDNVRILERNYHSKADPQATDKQQSWTWNVEGLRAIKREPYTTHPDTYFTSVKIAPSNFSYYHFKGSYRDWKELGKITFDHLLKDRRKLSVETVQLIKILVKNETTDIGKAKKIYAYLQKKTRYISVQIGIGGLQPISASEVDRLGYGDCKALVNYMQALLDIVGIPSYYCIVQAGNEKTDLLPDFASMEQGNHVILCIPGDGVTTWLECTSQDAPFGYLGSFTDDRWVLACTQEGGKLLKTPKFMAGGSQQLRSASLSLSKNGKVDGRVSTTFDGSQFDNHYFLFTKSPSEREKKLKYIYDINNLEFSSIDFDINYDMPRFTENLTIGIANYAQVGDQRISFVPNLLNQQPIVPSVTQRVLPLELKRGFTDIDSLVFQLDESISPMLLPKTIEISNKFGTYLVKIIMKEDKLLYYRKLVMNDGLFEPSEYEAYEHFVNEVAANDRIAVALRLKPLK